MMPFKKLGGKLLSGDRISWWDPRQDPLLSVWKWLDEEVEEEEERTGDDDSGDTVLQYL